MNVNSREDCFYEVYALKKTKQSTNVYILTLSYYGNSGVPYFIWMHHPEAKKPTDHTLQASRFALW